MAHVPLQTSLWLAPTALALPLGAMVTITRSGELQPEMGLVAGLVTALWVVLPFLYVRFTTRESPAVAEAGTGSAWLWTVLCWLPVMAYSLIRTLADLGYADSSLDLGRPENPTHLLPALLAAFAPLIVGALSGRAMREARRDLDGRA